MLFFEGEATESLIFLASGVVKLFKTSPDGKEQILSISHPEETLNEVPLFNGGLNATSAQAMMQVAVYMINKRDIEMIMKKYPLVASNVIHILAKKDASTGIAGGRTVFQEGKRAAGRDFTGKRCQGRRIGSQVDPARYGCYGGNRP